MITLDKIKSLNELELKIYQYVITHKKQVLNMKLKDISEIIHVSPSMITRVSQKLGYEGFIEWKTEMKIAEYDDLGENGRTLNYIIDYFHKVDNNDFEQEIYNATKLVAQSRETLFFGVGISGTIAKVGAYLFNRKGKRASSFEDFSMRVRDMYDENDCAIVLTVSGETKEIIDRIMSLKNLGVKTIVITNSASSTAGKMADIAICYYVPSYRNKDYYSSATQVPVIYIIESIANDLVKFGIY